MFKKLIIISIILFSCNANADEWTKTDIGLEVFFQIINTIDWSQTAVGIESGEYDEMCVVLPEKPSIELIYLMCAIVSTGHLFITDKLSGDKRTIWQCFTINKGVNTISKNYQVGVRFKF